MFEEGYQNECIAEPYEEGYSRPEESCRQRTARMRGPKGENGTPGADGSTWHSGTEVSGTGDVTAAVSGAKPGDFYLNTQTGAVYGCISEDAEQTQLWRYKIGIGNGTAEGVSIADAGGYFTGGTAEAALQELGAALDGVDALIGTGVIE